jgi:hypothetical protein
MANHKQLIIGKRHLFVLLGLIIISLLVISYAITTSASVPKIPISQVVFDIKAGNIIKIDLEEESSKMTVYYQPGSNPVVAKAIKEEGSLAQYLLNSGVQSEALPIISVHQVLTLRDYASIVAIMLTITAVTSVLRLVVLVVRRR